MIPGPQEEGAYCSHIIPGPQGAGIYCPLDNSRSPGFEQFLVPREQESIVDLTIPCPQGAEAYPPTRQFQVPRKQESIDQTARRIRQRPQR